MQDHPVRSHSYKGPVTDTAIWDDFDLRPDDVILSTPPKCGTTWSQAIVMMLIHDAAITDRMVWRDSVWLDCAFRNHDDQIKNLKEQEHIRCIKSHTPFDGIPFDPHIVYLAVYRHPIDVHFSMMKHVENMESDLLDFLSPPEPGAAFRRFLEVPANDTGTDDLTLGSLLLHYRSFARWAHLPNVHLFHYADLSRDLPACIRRYGEAIGLPPSGALVGEIAQAASFRAMKATTRKISSTASSGLTRLEQKFFDSGTSNKWVGRLSDAEISAYDKRISELTSPEERAWLEGGDTALR
ncbi:MAG: sulfotransferase domain-containing protein [Pseudomonadota bacterium]